MRCLFRRSNWLIIGLFCLNSVLGAQALDFHYLYGLCKQDDPDWTRIVEARQQALAALGSLPGFSPDLSFSLGAAGAAQSSASDLSLALPLAPEFSFPLRAGLDFRLPLLDGRLATRRALLESDWRLAELSHRDAASKHFADYLQALSRFAEAQGLAQARSETARSFEELRNFAERRSKLGAGSAKDALRARISAQQARIAATQAESASIQLPSAWGEAARSYLLQAEAAQQCARPELWEGLLRAAGLDTTGLLAEAADAKPPALPERASRGRDALEAARYELELRALEAERMPALDIVGALDADLRPDLEAALPFIASAELGLSFRWPLAASGLSPPGDKLQAEALALGHAARTQEQARRARGLEAAAAAYRTALAVLAERREANRVADAYAAALKAEQQAGTTSLESVIQGWQVVYQCREDELGALWQAIRAAVNYLHEADRLLAPGGPGA